MTSTHKQTIKLRLNDSRLIFQDFGQIIFTKEIFVFQFFSGGVCDIRNALSPEHAKRFLLLLQKQMEKYEKKHGEVKAAIPVLRGVPLEESE